MSKSKSEEDRSLRRGRLAIGLVREMKAERVVAEPSAEDDARRMIKQIFKELPDGKLKVVNVNGPVVADSADS